MSGEKTVQSKQVFQGRLLTVRVDEVELGDGRRARREIVEHPSAVAILALEGRGEDQRVALVRQFRKAVGSYLLEMPAGTLEAGEEPLECAQRELLEETGLTARQWTHLQTFYTTPGFCTEKMWLFLAQDLEPGRATASDEQITLQFCSRSQVLDMLKKGQLQDAKTLVGLLWWLRNS